MSGEETTKEEVKEDTIDTKTKTNVIFSKQFAKNSAVQVIFLDGVLQNIVIASDAGTARVSAETLSDIMNFFEDHKTVAAGG